MLALVRILMNKMNFSCKEEQFHTKVNDIKMNILQRLRQIKGPNNNFNKSNVNVL